MLENTMDAPLWEPSAQRVRDSEISKFQAHLNLPGDFKSLHEFSIKNKNLFW
jgi:hypothetical protein